MVSAERQTASGEVRPTRPTAPRRATPWASRPAQWIPVVPCWRQLVLRWGLGLKPTPAWPGQRG